MSFLSVAAPHTAEKVIEKSRFLTYAAHTAGEEEARAFLERVRAEHPLATHVCHAYVADRLGNLMRFSDDGEPQGTAGMPILGVLRARKLFECTVAVVRYFGGIKLGAGGLTRAYAGCAAECLDGTELALWDECVQLALTVGYSEVGALSRWLDGRCAILARDFAEQACFSVAVRAGECDAFCAELADFLNGRVKICEQKREFSPFPLDKADGQIQNTK